MMAQRIGKSPYRIYCEHCEQGELAYQIRSADGGTVFYPRVVSPQTASPQLEWRVSAGLGAVYATTVLRRRGQSPYNIALIDLDEGFRMMSRIEGVSPELVRIGMRVRVRMHPASTDQSAYPVFVPAESGQ